MERGSKPRLLDLFCGAGGCSVGYARAGFEVVGVDIEPQPNYPFEFHCGDALHLGRQLLDAGRWDAIHASPPCQAFSLASLHRGRGNQARHPDLIEPTRRLLAGYPSVIENVIGAPVRADLTLCGEMFGLRVHRHRIFETEGFLAMQPPHSRHRLKGAKHNCHIEDGYARQVVGNYADHESASRAMGIDWMTRAELSQAIPPAYTEHIGEYLLRTLQADVSATDPRSIEPAKEAT